jgi:CRP/FNR family transcriptional regulator, cyclic AMP receptor protein
MPAQRSNQSLLWQLQDNLSADLFASAAPLRLAANEALFLAGDSGDGCYLVEDGLLKVVVASHSGGERILAFLGRGAIVGEMSVIDGRPRSASVVVVRQAALKFLSRASFEEFTNKYPDVYKYLMKLLASRLREANAVIAAGTFLSLKGRVARTLLDGGGLRPRCRFRAHCHSSEDWAKRSRGHGRHRSRQRQPNYQ